ncbi:MAG TPA: hypothetical protein DIW52_01340 [Pseudomonas sp.]|nr:hypothetical protein [Pseudomonas sp.]
MHYGKHHRSKCGSGLAREIGVSNYIYVTDTPLSRASPLPQWICAMPEITFGFPNATRRSIRLTGLFIAINHVKNI